MSLRKLHQQAEQARHKANDAAARFHRAVAAALADGQSATVIAQELEVSRGRVYQWRDKA